MGIQVIEYTSQNESQKIRLSRRAYSLKNSVNFVISTSRPLVVIFRTLIIQTISALCNLGVLHIGLQKCNFPKIGDGEFEPVQQSCKPG